MQSRRPAAAVALATLLLAATGCGSSGSSTSKTGTLQTAPPAAAAAATDRTVAPAPPKPTTTTRQPANGRPATPKPGSEAEYDAALVQLSKDLDSAIDGAAKSGDSTEIAKVLKQITTATKAWTDAGHAAGAGATALDAAGQTAVSAVESPLLLDEAHRQVAAARAALGG